VAVCNVETNAISALDYARRAPFTAGARGTPMQRTDSAYYTPVRIVSYVILLLMIAAIAYSAYISILYWDGIGV
jgi:hypothetical protein